MFGTPSLGRIQQLLQSQGSGFLLLVAIEGGIEITQLKSNLLQSMTDFVISWRPLWWLHNIKSKAGATDMTDMEGVEDSELNISRRKPKSSVAPTITGSLGSDP